MFNPLIGFSNRADVLQAHLFNQAILERLLPFHATFAWLLLAQINSITPSSRRPSELGCANTSFRLHDLNTRMLVAVNATGLPMFINVLPGSHHVVKRVF
jgi:hypothetical protein